MLNQSWSAPTGDDPKLGKLDRIAVGPEPHGTRLSADWLPFMPGTTRPYLPAALVPPADDPDGTPWQLRKWHTVRDGAKTWRLRHWFGSVALSHPKKIEDVCFSPDLRFVAVATGEAWVWDWTTGREIRRIGHAEPYRVIGRACCTNRWLITSTSVLDIESGKELRHVNRLVSVFRGILMIRGATTTGDLLVTSDLGYWALLDSQTWQLRHHFELDYRAIFDLHASPAGPQVAWVHQGQLRMWDDTQQAERALPQAPSFTTHRLAGFTCDGQKLVRYNMVDPRLDVLDAQSGAIVAHWRIPTFSAPDSVALLANDEIVVAGHSFARLRGFKLHSGEPTLDLPWQGGRVWGSPCGRYFAGVGGRPGQLEIRDMDGRLASPGEDSLSRIADWGFSADSKSFVLIEGRRLHRVFLSSGVKQTWNLPDLDSADLLALAAYGDLAAIGGSEGSRGLRGRVVVWDLCLGQSVKALDGLPVMRGLRFTADGASVEIRPLDHRYNSMRGDLTTGSVVSIPKREGVPPHVGWQHKSASEEPLPRLPHGPYLNVAAADESRDHRVSPDGKWTAVETRRGLLLLFEGERTRQ